MYCAWNCHKNSYVDELDAFSKALLRCKIELLSEFLEPLFIKNKLVRTRFAAAVETLKKWLHVSDLFIALYRLHPVQLARRS